MMNVNRQEAAAISKMLQEIDGNLSAEEKEDRNHRHQHGAAWTAIPSETLNQEIRGDHSRYSKLLRDAASSDQLVEQQLAQKMASLSTLAGSRVDYDRRMPQVSAATTAAVAPVRDELIRLLKELNVVLKKRVNFIDSLRSMANRDDITDDLVAAGCGAVNIGE